MRLAEQVQRCRGCGAEFSLADGQVLSASGECCMLCALERHDTPEQEARYVQEEGLEGAVVARGLALPHAGALTLREGDARRVYAALEAQDADLVREWVEEYFEQDADRQAYRDWLLRNF